MRKEILHVSMVDGDEWEDRLQVLVHSPDYELCIEFGARLLGERECCNVLRMGRGVS
jgi:hypothetical protein